MDQLSRTQNFTNNSFSTGNAYKKKISSTFNQTVANIVKKELQKRHESPRSRRQLLQNLAAQGASRKVGSSSGNNVMNLGGTMQYPL